MDTVIDNFTHNSVLLAESITALNIKVDGVYIDGTFGRGGHTVAIANKLTTGKIIAFDKDPQAIAFAQENIQHPNIEVIHSDFSNMFTILQEKNLIGKVSGILLDLGVSSPQLDDKSRGFSFMGEDPLDMRMDTTSGQSASQWLSRASQTEIADVIYQYGEERKSRIIAQKIKQYIAEVGNITTTKQLADIISSVIPKTGKKHPATRTFQAIRIHINSELTSLQTFLQSSIDILQPGGRLAIISFHSLEDRIVKQFIKQHSTAEQPPKNMPFLPENQAKMPLKALKKQKPSKAEISENIRSRSSILRVCEKC
jgi:16S rRNA (cytosine1402-N4)-methyltransferase